MSASEPALEVAHILTSAEVGGAEQVVLQLIPAMRALGFDGRVVCLRRGGQLEASFRRAAIRVDILENSENVGALGLARRLARHLRASAPDIIHTHNASPLVVGALARRLARVPTHVHTKHGAGGGMTTLGRSAAWWAVRQLDAHVAVSAATRQHAIDSEATPPRTIQVLRNGISIGAPTPDRDQRRWSAMTVGRLEPIKGHRYLIAAMPQILRTNPSFRLAIVGDGSERVRLTEQAADLGVRESVDFLGMRDDVVSLLACTDVFILPSISEGVSLTLLEAMAAGRAIVATAVGGTPEVVVHEQSALLVAPASDAALADAVLRLQANPSLAASLGGTARGVATAEFSLQNVAERYARLYRNLPLNPT